MAQVTLVLYSVKHYGYYITIIPRKIEILFNTLEHAYQTATKQDYIIINKLKYNPKEKNTQEKKKLLGIGVGNYFLGMKTKEIQTNGFVWDSSTN